MCNKEPLLHADSLSLQNQLPARPPSLTGSGSLECETETDRCHTGSGVSACRRVNTLTGETAEGYGSVQTGGYKAYGREFWRTP